MEIKPLQPISRYKGLRGRGQHVRNRLDKRTEKAEVTPDSMILLAFSLRKKQLQEKMVRIAKRT